MKLLEKRVGFDLKSNYFSYPEAGKFNDLDITNMTIIIFILCLTINILSRVVLLEGGLKDLGLLEAFR